MELKIINYTNTLNCIKFECKYKDYTYYLSERIREKINGGYIYYIFTKVRNVDKKIISTNDDNIDSPSYIRKYRSSKICKRIYYHIININKLADGKIKDYQIFNKFELDFLCHYLLNKNIVYEIVVIDIKEKITKFKYISEEYQKNIKSYIEWVNDSEANKVHNFYKIYVRVYKGFIDGCKSKEKSKYMVYIW